MKPHKPAKREQSHAEYFTHPDAIRRGLAAMAGREEAILAAQRLATRVRCPKCDGTGLVPRGEEWQK